MKKTALALFLLITISAQSQVVINEYSAANRDVWTDNYGDDPDWFELYNSGGAAVNLGGYFLTDNPDNLDKWEIPLGFTVNAGETVRIWASGRGESDGVNHHADFKLTQMRQEFIILSDPGLAILDQVWIESPNKLGHSSGRLTDGGAVWGVFENPTPGNPNSGGVTGYAPTPAFSQAAGFYGGAQNISITTDSGFDIRYTTDGTEPDAGSALYAAPVNLADVTTLRARSFSDGGSDHIESFTATNTYFIAVSHTFSTFSVNGQLEIWGGGGGSGGGGGGGWGGGGGPHIVSVEFFDEAGVRQWQLEGEMRRHGNDSWAYNQRGMRLHVHDEYGYANKIDHQMFSVKDRTDFDVIIIKAAGSDNYPGSPAPTAAHLRDGWVQTLSHNAGLEVDERTYEHTINYLNGEYWGVYEYRERIDEDFTQEYYNTSGNEMDMLEQWGGVDVEYGTLQNWEDTYDFIRLNDMTVDANYQAALQLISKESFIDYMIINTFFVNSDWLNWNTKWWQGLDANNPMPWRYALWDMDNISDLGQNYTGWSSTGFESPTVCEVSTVFGNGPSWNSDVGHSEIYRNLLENESFFQDYINRYTDLLNGALHCDAMTALLDQFEAEMLPEMQGQVDRWGGSVAGWQDNVDAIRQFNCDRYDFVYTVIQDCFPDLEGPFNVTANVNGVGEILFSTTSVTDTFEGIYFGGLTISLEAIETCGSTFTGWNVVSGDAVFADPMAFNQEVNLTSDLVVEATFIPNNAPIDIYFQTDPPGFGGIMIDGIEITTPGTYAYTAGTQLELSAIESGFEIFDNWEVINNEILGDDDDVVISLNACENDTIIAEFDVFLSDQLTFDVMPVGSGTITAEGLVIPIYPTTDDFAIDLNIDAEATPADASWQFVEWQLNNHVLNPDEFSTIVDFDFLVEDTLIAIFEEVPTFSVVIDLSDADAGIITSSGNEYEAGDIIEIIEGGALSLNVTANEWYEFDYWVTSGGVIIDGNDTDALLDFIISGDGTITAVFIYTEHWDISIDVFPIGSGTVNLDGLDLTTYPQIETYTINDNIDLIATPIDQWWYFSHWEAAGQLFTPDNLQTAVSASIQSGDAIVAVFIELENYDITVQVKPQNAGVVSFDLGYVTSTEWTGVIQGNVPSAFTAVENPFYKFIGWTSSSHAPTPSNDNANVVFNFSQTDTVVAVFEQIDFSFFIPNTFTPNQDGLNEVWLPVSSAADPEAYHCIIFNRQGEVVFETKDLYEGWDGSFLGKDHYVIDGVYNFIITTKSYHELGNITKKGHITIIR